MPSDVLTPGVTADRPRARGWKGRLVTLLSALISLGLLVVLYRSVQFARVTGPRSVEAWIWERGAGETLASGSSASAVCAAGVKRGLLEPGEITVNMPGGSVTVEVTAQHDVILLGPAQIIYEAELSAGARDAYHALD